jgi:nicotinamidase-related amidase
VGDRLLPLPLTERSVHLCVDMQRIFSAGGAWPTPWMDRVLPVATALASRHPERTIFTRFAPQMCIKGPSLPYTGSLRGRATRSIAGSAFSRSSADLHSS